MWYLTNSSEHWHSKQYYPHFFRWESWAERERLDLGVQSVGKLEFVFLRPRVFPWLVPSLPIWYPSFSSCPFKTSCFLLGYSPPRYSPHPTMIALTEDLCLPYESLLLGNCPGRGCHWWFTESINVTRQSNSSLPPKLYVLLTVCDALTQQNGGLTGIVWRRLGGSFRCWAWTSPHTLQCGWLPPHMSVQWAVRNSVKLKTLHNLIFNLSLRR